MAELGVSTHFLIGFKAQPLYFETHIYDRHQGQEPVVDRAEALGKNLLLLLYQVDIMTPNDLSLYPEISLSLSPHQRSFFLQ